MFSVIVVPPLQRDGRDGGVGPSGGSVDLVCGVSKKRLFAEGILGDPTQERSQDPVTEQGGFLSFVIVHYGISL